MLIVGLAFVLSRDSEADSAAVTVQTIRTTIAVPTTPSTLATTTTMEPTTTAAAEIDTAAAAAGFRAHLGTLNVGVGDETTDDDLKLTGSLTCFSAKALETPADWDLYSATEAEDAHQLQIDRAEESPLSAELWVSVLDARLVFYCPDEANRLAVTL